MKEYVVPFTDKTEMEKFEALHGTNGELIRCKDCKVFKTCSWSEREPQGFCAWAEPKKDI